MSTHEITEMGIHHAQRTAARKPSHTSPMLLSRRAYGWQRGYLMRSAAWVVAMALAMSACSSARLEQTGRYPDGSAVETVRPGSRGVTVQFPVSFSEARQVMGVDLRLGEHRPEKPTAFFTENTVDERASSGGAGMHEELDVSADETMVIEGHFRPPCDEEPDEAEPTATVTSIRDSGEVETDTLTVPQPEGAVADAIRSWCADASVDASLSGWRVTTEGEVMVRYSVFNPGPDDVTVSSRGATSGDMQWYATESVTVAADEEVELRIHGRRLSKRQAGQGAQPQPDDLGLIEAVGSDGTQTLTDTTG